MHADQITQPCFWTAARAMLARMRVAVGEAASLAERAWIGGDEQKAVRTWLSPLIAMVRKLVLIEAIALLRAPASPQKRLRAVDAKHRHDRPAASPGPRTPSLRLWPKKERQLPRIRQLGPPLLVRDIWRDNARAAAARQLSRVRFMREPPGVRLARRIEALTRVLDKPLIAARRLAKKLREIPKLVLKLIKRKLPRTHRCTNEEYQSAGDRAFDDAVQWLHADTS